MSKFYLKHSEEISFVSKNIIFNDAVILIYGIFMVNKTSTGGRGGKIKFKKRYQYFFKKGFLRGGILLPRGGTQKFFSARLRAHLVPPLKQKPSYAPD